MQRSQALFGGGTREGCSVRYCQGIALFLNALKLCVATGQQCLSIQRAVPNNSLLHRR